MYARGEDPGLSLDTALAALVEVGARGTGQNLRPEGIELRRPADALGLYEKHFGCPVTYGARYDAVTFSARHTERPMINPNPQMAALIEPQLEAELAERLGSTWVDRVRAVLKRMMAGARPSVDDVASQLHQSSRTLQRRLAEEGTRFQDLLDEVRMALARTYLVESELTLGQIASLVGYDEPHSFHRAFRALEGVAPGRWRTESHAR